MAHTAHTTHTARTVHTFSGLGLHVALDVESGAVHLLDEIGLAVLRRMAPPIGDSCPPDLVAALSPDFAPEDVEEAWGELHALVREGQLFSPKTVYPAPGEMGEEVRKALCLHVAHDCDLRCGYCFAQSGHYGGKRGIMPFEIAKAAIDRLVGQSGPRRNLEIDFFGGEPLLAWDTVTRAVGYVRAHEGVWGKRFRFTLTTNGLALADDRIDFLNREMDNLVLSLDGRRDTHDALRRTPAGEGSYDAVLNNLRRVLATRRRSYYLRGTFTARNPDFVDDLLHMADLGFQNLSMEPVVLPAAHPLALREEHMDTVCRAYDRLLEIMSRRDDFSFFHFTVDLAQGPCVYKRLRGCGAGFAYAAVSPSGDLYPCHQFVGQPAYKMGNVRGGGGDGGYDGDGDGDGDVDGDVGVNAATAHEIAKRLSRLTVDAKPACAACWARFYCGGGCAAAGVLLGGQPDSVYELGCRMQKKRLECAILLRVGRMISEDEKPAISKGVQLTEKL